MELQDKPREPQGEPTEEHRKEPIEELSEEEEAKEELQEELDEEPTEERQEKPKPEPQGEPTEEQRREPTQEPTQELTEEAKTEENEQEEGVRSAKDGRRTRQFFQGMMTELQKLLQVARVLCGAVWANGSSSDWAQLEGADHPPGMDIFPFLLSPSLPRQGSFEGTPRPKSHPCGFGASDGICAFAI